MDSTAQELSFKLPYIENWSGQESHQGESAPQFEHKENDLLFVISDSVVHPIVHAHVCTLMCIRSTSLNCC